MVGTRGRKPTALLVVAAWHEGAPPSLAARITYAVDTSRAERVTLTAAGTEAIAAVVSDWLAEVERAAGRRDAAVTDE